MIIVYLVGIDGAGKTTLGKHLAKALGGRYFYFGSGRGVRKTIRVVARKLFLRKSDPNKYSEFKEARREWRQSKPYMVTVYAWTQYIYLTIASWWKLRIASPDIRVAVLDRYYVDLVVGMASLLQYDRGRSVRILKILKRLVPQPDITLFLDLTEEAAITRKRDVPSIEYLRERRTLYEELRDVVPHETIDANQPYDLVFAEAMSIISQKLHRPVQEPSLLD